MSDKLQIQESCPMPAIAGYVDGELRPDEEMELEIHLAGCGACTEELNMQKSILLALDASLESDAAFDLPDNFTRRIVATAESSVSGLRRSGERLTAAAISAGLLVFALFLLGSDISRAMAPAAAAAEKLIAFAGSAGHVVYDIALGIAIVFRALLSILVFDSFVSVAGVAAVSAVLLYLLTRPFLSGRDVQ